MADRKKKSGHDDAWWAAQRHAYIEKNDILLPIIEHVFWVADSLPELYLRLASVCRHAIISLSRMPLLPTSLLGLFLFYLRL